MIIDQSYFTQGYLVVPNLNQPHIIALVNNYIEVHEDKLLSLALGETMKAALLEGLAEDTVEERWSKLKDGFVFDTNSGTKQSFVGLAPANQIKQGVIAPYVYFYLVRENLTTFTGSAVTVTATENSMAASPMQKLSQAWNNCASEVRKLWYYLRNNKDLYPEFNEQEIDYTAFANVNAFGI